MHRCFGGSFLILLLCTTPSLAKRKPTAPGPKSAVPTISVESRLVVLDVVVLDHRKPVCGLKKRDFEIFEDKQYQPVGFFQSHCGKAREDEANQALKPPPLPPDTYDNLPVSPTADSITVLLLDGLNTQVPDSQYLRLQMIQYLKNLPAGQRIAIFTLGSKLSLLQGFTTDSKLLLQAIESRASTSAASLLPSADHQIAERQELDTLEAGGISPLVISGMRNFMTDSDTQQTGMRAGITLDALQEMARYLGAFPGRKNLIWFSGSFPLEIYGDIETPSFTTYVVPMGDFERELKATAAMLAADRVAVYPVDVRGVLVDPMFDASVVTDYGETIGGVPVGQQRFLHDAMTADLERIAEHGTMDILAKDTGGRAVYDSNALKEAVADALSDGENFYTLAYRPRDGNYNGKWRKIELFLDRKPAKGKYTLLFRHGYFATSDSPVSQEKPARKGNNNEVSHGFAAAMQDGALPSSQILFKARVVAWPKPPSGAIDGDNPKLKHRAARYVIDYAVSLRHVGLAATPEGDRLGKLMVAAMAYNDDGRAVNWESNTDSIRIPSRDWNLYAEDGLQIHQVLDLPNGTIHLRLGVYDPASGSVGTMEIPLEVKVKVKQPAAVNLQK